MNTLLLIALKITVIFGIAGVASLLLRRARAAARHYVWGLALLGALALPVVSLVSPRVELAVLPAAELPGVPPTTSISEVLAPLPPMAALVPSRNLDGSAGAVTTADLPWLPIVWGGGAAIILALIGLSVFATDRLRRGATPVAGGPMVHELETARSALGIRRPVRLLIGRHESMPMTWGALRPVVLLPSAAVDWSPARRRDVLLHELAHVRRLDWLSQLGARMACAAYWWHPLAWYAARRLRDERELACDDLVLSHGASAEDYAHHLLTIARDMRVASHAALAGVAMARPSQLAGRLVAVLDGTRKRSGLARRHAGTAALAALALLLPVAGFTAVAASPDRGPDKAKAAAADAKSAAGAWTSEPTNVVAVGTRAPAPDVARTTLCTWDDLGNANSTSSNIDDDRVTITIVVDRCELSVRSRGMVRFTEDERDIADLGMDSWFEVEERARDGARRRAEFERRNGAIQRRWYVDGHEQPWDAAAAEWFQGALLVAFRRTSFQARERAARIYARGGGPELMAEAERLFSSGAMMAYLELYADQETISSDEARRIARLAGERIRSSSNLSSVLQTLLRNPGIDDVARADIVAATRRISSSSARAAVLVSAAEYAPLTPVLADAVLQSAGEISSASERGRVLTYVGSRLPPDVPLPGSYVTAARGISSSSVLGEVLVSLLERDRLTSAQVAAVLELAAEISSTSERSRVLTAILARHRLDERTRDPFFRVVESISSSSTKVNVLREVLAKSPDAETTARVLEVARTVSSSSERAGVLVEIANAGLLTTEALRTAYLRAVNAISPRGERERALRAAGAL